MFMKLYAVGSLDDINISNRFPGQNFILPTGEVYQLEARDELGGVGSFFKKLGAIALPLVGTIAAPFTGGMSLALTSAINAGGAIGGGLLASAGGGGGGAGGQAKGLAAIQSAGQKVISQFDLLNQKISSGELSKTDAYAASDQLVAVLSDSSAFYQPKKGKDAEALANFKTQAAQAAQKSKALADALEANRQQQQQQQPQSTGARQMQLPTGEVYQLAARQQSQSTGARQMQRRQTIGDADGAAAVADDDALIGGVGNQTLVYVAVGIAALLFLRG